MLVRAIRIPNRTTWTWVGSCHLVHLLWLGIKYLMLGVLQVDIPVELSAETVCAVVPCLKVVEQVPVPAAVVLKLRQNVSKQLS